MEVSDAVVAVSIAYPRVWHTLHRTHPTDRSPVSPRDTAILTHVVDRDGISPGDLARHLGVSAGTLSEGLADLEGRGLLTRTRDADDKRRLAVSATPAGRAAIATGSGLDPDRLTRALTVLTAEDRATVVRGLELLARAAREVR